MPLPIQATSLPALSKDQFDLIILDGSGSMADKWWDMLAAIDSYVDELKNCKTQSHIRLSIFTSPRENLDLVARDVDIDQWIPLSQNPVGSHWGGTPLYDAIQNGLLLLRNMDPARCAITIVTDGEENHSTQCTKEQCKSYLDWARHKGWAVTFIGCDYNNSGTAKALGASPSEAIGVAKAQLSNASRELARKRAAYAASGAPMHWSQAEQRQFGGYLADHSSAK